jgi:hypothetical protein
VAIQCGGAHKPPPPPPGPPWESLSRCSVTRRKDRNRALMGPGASSVTGYVPRFGLGRRVGISDAMEGAARLSPRTILPIHEREMIHFRCRSLSLPPPSQDSQLPCVCVLRVSCVVWRGAVRSPTLEVGVIAGLEHARDLLGQHLPPPLLPHLRTTIKPSIHTVHVGASGLCESQRLPPL